MSAASGVLELQHVDDRLRHLASQIAALEASLAGDPQLDEARRTLAARDADRRDSEADVDAADREAAGLRDRARVIERQLFGGSVRNPTDLLTLQRELDDVKERLAVAEETELARMESAEQAERAAAEASAAVEAIERRRAAAAGPDTERLEALRRETVAATEERRLVVSRLPDAHLALYERVAARRTPAVASLRGDACGGCRVPLGMREVRAAKTGDALVQCPNCDRIAAP